MRSWGKAAFQGLTVVATVVLSGLSAGAQDLPKLPTRAFAVDGGLVAVQGGVMNDPGRAPLAIGKLKYPMLYFVTVKNETTATVWAEVELWLDDKKPKKDDAPLDAGKAGFWRWPAYGVIVDQPIKVRVALFSDKTRKKPLGDKTMTMKFDMAERDILYNPPKPEKGGIAVAMIAGWHEMGRGACDPKGTAADKGLSHDICLSLWKAESIDYLDCEHPIAAVEPLESEKSALLAAQPEDFRGRAEAFRAKGDLILEKWSLKSCDNLRSYEVMMIKAPQGGTDFQTRAMP